jgi:hypothetical protein
MLDLLHTEELYKRKITSPSDVDKIKADDSTFLTEVIKGMEEKLEALTRKTIILNASTEQVSKKVKLELPILFSKTSSLDATIGKQVKDEMADFAAPTVWSSIVMLTTLYHDTQCQVQDLPHIVSNIKQDFIIEMSRKLDQKVARSSDDTMGKLVQLKKLVVTSLDQIGSRFQFESTRFDNLIAKVVSVEQEMLSAPHSQQNVNVKQVIEYADAEINVLRNSMSEMNRKLDELIADTHQDAIKFNGFGFRRYEEAAAWLETHSPDHKFGLIVDVHMVFEHLYSAAEKTVPALQQLKKIEMTNMSQGVAVSSFDQPIPKLLCDGTGYSVVQTDESYFDRVKSFKEWDAPHTGYRARLKQDLRTFDAAHCQLVANNTLPQSALHATASLSRTYSISWIEAFIIFIDDTYAELTQAKFSAVRGWSLITRLAYCILVEVSAPRNGIKQTFTTGRNDLIAKQFFWSIIQSQDLMANYKDKSFKNDPSVSSEYVKFLVMNTGMDLVDQLVKRVTVLEEKINGLIKDVKVAESKSSTASNGVSSLTKAIETLTKRVSSLESKK